ncbi:MAG TPA: phosphate ABC transporter substrate-binding protein PstS [Solirubrobacterales bacterium]|nr:phosphate ABC transporter substrate-binding protein PstS [Solirubrobacterales bacterium]
MKRKWWLIPAASALLALTVAACGGSDNGGGGSGASGTIAGAGSSAQQAAQEAWVAKFEGENSSATISYDPIGSGGGRDQFIAGGNTAFAGSDSPFDTDELPKATQRCQSSGGDLVQIPNYLSAIAIIYNLPGVDNLQLSPDVTAKIFKGEITKWNDPAIAADNPGANLPDTDITPVHRSDESGTTANFTDYLHEAAGNVWTFESDSSWPLKSGESGAQTSGMVQAVKAGEGAIGYADESQAGDLGVAKVKVGNTYVAPSAQGASNDFDQSQKDPELSQGKYVFAYKVQRTPTDPSAYPVLLVSYLMGCTKYDSTDTTNLVKAYFNFIVSDEGQQVAQQNAGSSPIPPGIKKEDTPAIDAIGS